MLNLFRKNQASTDAAGCPRTPEDMRIYAIGDIHGRDDLLRLLHERILDDAARHPYRQKIAIYLGDYVDRGPDSCDVLERLSTRPLPDFTSIYLMGNHEQALLGFMRDPGAWSNWLLYGSLATLSSYGVSTRTQNDQKPLHQVAQELALKMPAHQLDFLDRLETWRVFGDYCFVHAGIRPNIPLERQNPDDLLWIRDEFLHYSKPHPKVVVHGHQISDEPEVRSNRIGIDTGAFATGRLTCLVLDGEEQTFIDTRRLP